MNQNVTNTDVDMCGGDKDNSPQKIQIHLNYFKFTEEEFFFTYFFIYYKIVFKCKNMVTKPSEPNYGNC